MVNVITGPSKQIGKNINKEKVSYNKKLICRLMERVVKVKVLFYPIIANKECPDSNIDMVVGCHLSAIYLG